MSASDNISPVALLVAGVVANKPEIVKEALARGASANTVTDQWGRPLMHIAVENASPKIILLLGQAGADPDPIWEGLTPLAAAVTAGDHPVMRALLALKANPSATIGRRALFLLDVAIYRQDFEAAQILAQAGNWDLDQPFRGRRLIEHFPDAPTAQSLLKQAEAQTDRLLKILRS